VLRRRIVVSLLVLVSLGLLTVYFRESSGGGLHNLQSTGSSVLRPFEVAANRVAQPFRDAASWVSELSGARSENKKLRRELAQARADVIRYEAAIQENTQLKKLLRYSQSASFPQGFRPLAASVIVRPPGQFDQRLVIDRGRADGVQLNDPVVTPEGLGGQVTRVYSNEAQVTLITDEASFVSVLDLKTGAAGLLRHSDSGSSIIMDNVPKADQVEPGDKIITAGWHTPKLSSIFPRGIPVGFVSSVNQTDIDPNKQIEVTPFVDFGGLQYMFVLAKKSGTP
jgi:rod shape-determining protein MreC